MPPKRKENAVAGVRHVGETDRSVVVLSWRFGDEY